MRTILYFDTCQHNVLMLFHIILSFRSCIDRKSSGLDVRFLIFVLCENDNNLHAFKSCLSFMSALMVIITC